MVDTYARLPELIETAARAGAIRLAPEELPVFASVAEAWRRDPTPIRSRSAPGGSIGFGLDAVLISEIALQAVTSAFGDLFVVGAAAAGAGWRRRWRRPRRTSTPAPASIESNGSPPPPTLDDGRLALTDTQARALREACRRHAVTLGLSEEQAALLADAAVGALHGRPEPE